MNAAELVAFLRSVFPQAHMDRIHIETLEDKRLVMRYVTRDDDLRPGNTVSGPTLMALSDLSMYLAVLAQIGPVPLAVTTSLNINFLRKPSPGELVVEALLLKLGKQLAVGEVFVRNEEGGDPVSHATVTYSIPARSA